MTGTETTTLSTNILKSFPGSCNVMIQKFPNGKFSISFKHSSPTPAVHQKFVSLVKTTLSAADMANVVQIAMADTSGNLKLADGLTTPSQTWGAL